MTRSVRLVLVAIFATFSVQVLVLILAPLRAVDLGLGISTAAAIVAAWGLFGLIADIPASALSDVRGRRPAIAAGGIAMLLAAVVLALASDLSEMLAGMLLFGLGQALSFGPLLAFLTEVSESDAHARVQGVNGALQGIGSIVGALLAGVFAVLDPSLAFIPVVALSIVVVVAILPVQEHAARTIAASTVRRVLGSYGRALRMVRERPAVSFGSLLSVLYSITFLVVAASILPLVLVEIEGYGPALAGAVIALRNLASALLSMTFAAVTSRFGVARTVVRLSWLAALGTALLGVATASPLLIWIPLLIQAVGLAYGVAASNVLVTRQTTVDERAVGMSATTVASRLTVLIVPLAVAPLIAPATVDLAFLLAAAICVPVIVLMHKLARDLPDGGPRDASVHAGGRDG